MRPVRTPATLLLLLLLTASSAQQNNHWFLGHFASLDFTGGTATPTTGALETLEGTATISDQGGNLLFYTEGSTIWDRNNNVMPNGAGLLGGSSSTQAALIVPKPGACGIYYVFTTQDHQQNGDFRYSVVDMCLNDGFGDVIAGQKNIMINTPCAEKLTAVPNPNGTDYWIITHELGGDAFLAYTLTPTGLDPVPVVSAVGSNHASNCMIGPLKASHDGTKLVCSKTFCTNTEMFDFDASTGVVSNAVDLADDYNLPNGVYGVEFSPNDQLLYISTTWAVNRLYQIDLVTQQVEQLVEGPGGGYFFGALQLAPDGRIYMARKDEVFLDVVDQPDVVGVGCNYLAAGFSLAAGTTSDIGMPCMIPATILPAEPGTFDFDLGPDTSLCNGAFTLTPPNACDDFFLWQDGSTANTFTVTAPGTYWVQISNSCGLGADSIVVSNVGGVLADLGPDTSLCAGESIVLAVPTGSDSVLWQDGSTQDELQVSDPGAYSVQVFAGGCIGTDSVVITLEPLPQAAFTFSLDTCSRTVFFSNASQNASGLDWDLDDNASSTVADPTHTYSTAGSFSVTLVVQNNCGVDEVQQQLDIPDPGQLTLSGPDTLCEGVSGTYQASLSGTTPSTIAWSDGSLDTMMIAFGPALSDWLSVDVVAANGCAFSDSVFITLLPLPIADFSWQSQNCGTQVQFSDQSAFTTGWDWDLGNGDHSTIASPAGTYAPPGPYSVILVALNDCGSDTTTQQLVLAPLGQLDLSGPGTLCAGANGAYLLELTGTDIATIAWSDGTLNETELSFSTITDAILSAEVTGVDGCVYSDTIAIDVLPLPAADFTWTQNACDSIIQFQDNSLNAIGWTWDLAPGQSSSAPDPIGLYPGPGNYPVELIVTNPCGNDTSVHVVTLDAIGDLVLSGPSLVCNEEPVTFTAAISSGSIASIVWSTGDSLPSIVLEIDGDLELGATVLGADGCTYSASLPISVIGAGGASAAYVPNVFTPNGDGLNESFGAVMADPDGFLELLVFNRWGQEIFSSTSLTKPWNGRFNSEPVPDGTYVYIVRWRDRCSGTKREEHGHVTLLR